MPNTTHASVNEMPLVFIHGAQQDAGCWAAVAAACAQNGRSVLAVDLPGHGQSTAAPCLTVEAMADWLLGQLDAAGVAQAVIIGHSMGSLVGMELALRHPQRVARLALVGSALPMPVAPALLETAARDEEGAMATINTWSLAPQVLAREAADGNSSPAALNRQIMARQRPGLLAVDLQACNAYARAPATLADIAVPVLIVAGGQDRMTSRRAARALRQAIPASRLAEIVACGHMMMAESPRALETALGAFISS